MYTNRSSFRKMIHPFFERFTFKVNSNPYLKSCTTLQSTTDILYELYEKSNKTNSEVYRKLYDFVNRDMEPSIDEIDDMLLVCRILLDNNCQDELEEFILNCPTRFIVTFVNNSETSPYDLQTIQMWGLTDLYNYLLKHVHTSKWVTWNERYNKS